MFPDQSFGQITKDSLLSNNHWGLVVFFPAAFTFVCPTELLAFNAAHASFAERRVNVVFVSVDSKHAHLAWRRQTRDKGGLGEEFHFPLVGDVTKNVSRAFDVLIDDDSDDAGLALRASFLIDPAGIVRHASLSDLPVGRSVDETLRLVDAFSYAAQHPDQGCPANWVPGQRNIRTDPVGSKEYFKAQWGGE